MKRALIIPDCHIPYEDKRAYELMLAVGEHINPEEIVILGDYADFYDVSSHPKDQDTGSKLIDEIDAVCDRLRELRRKFPLAKIVYIEGNHEYRLSRYIRDNCSEFFGIISWDKLLNLSAYNIQHINYDANQKYNILGSKLLAKHEPTTKGLHCAHGTVSKCNASVIFGHTHRLQESQIVSINDENFRGISCGWLGDKYNPVFNYVKDHHQWALGFSVCTVLPCGTWLNQLIHIIDYKVVVDGYLFTN